MGKLMTRTPVTQSILGSPAGAAIFLVATIRAGAPGDGAKQWDEGRRPREATAR